MAMTKAEKAELERLATLAAFNRTEKVDFDLDVPGSSGEKTEGWAVIGTPGNSIRVERAWSESVAHGFGEYRKYGASQRGIKLYSTKLLALKAMRNQIEEAAARSLRNCDLEIEQEAARLRADSEVME